MKAVILAAGIGSRLRPLTEKKPKCLVEVNGKPILGHTLDALLQNGVRDIVVVTGYRADSVNAFCAARYKGKEITFVENKEYDSSNNLYSLYLARKHLSGDTLLMNGDLVFDTSVIKKLITVKKSAIAVDKGRFMDESMKVVVKGGCIVHISKQIKPLESYGCSIDVYKFVKRDATALIAELENTVDSGDRTEWTEAALDRLFSSGRIKASPMSIGKARWSEIDNLDDLRQAERQFNPALNEFAKRKIFFVDNDGTLALDGKALPGAQAFLEALARAGKTFYLCTNNSSLTPSRIAAKLKASGLPLSEENVLISTDAALEYLKSNKVKRLFSVANAEAADYIKKAGFVLDDKNPDALLLTYDTEITYEKLVKLVTLIRAGIPYYATHIDRLCPTKDGFVPDIGIFIDAIAEATGVHPLKTFGKPNPNFILPILKKHKLSTKDAVVIGDRLYTDIALAEKSGALGALVLSGETTQADYETSPSKTDIVVSNVAALIPYLNAKDAQ